jgi:hypothetical protein
MQHAKSACARSVLECPVKDCRRRTTNLDQPAGYQKQLCELALGVTWHSPSPPLSRTPLVSRRSSSRYHRWLPHPCVVRATYVPPTRRYAHQCQQYAYDQQSCRLLIGFASLCRWQTTFLSFVWPSTGILHVAEAERSTSTSPCHPFTRCIPETVEDAAAVSCQQFARPPKSMLSLSPRCAGINPVFECASKQPLESTHFLT